jgi:8-hydroxy-5-deazaflavin:NADPH oxidoreductase
VDAGTLFESWRFECAKPVYCVRFASAGVKQALMAAERNVKVLEGSWRMK